MSTPRRGSPPRQAPRFTAQGVSLRAPRLQAELVNLSLGGAAIQTTGGAPRIGAEVLCELENAHTTAVVSGKIRWCRLDGTARNGNGEILPIYNAGIHFQAGSTPENLLRILRAMSLARQSEEG